MNALNHEILFEDLSLGHFALFNRELDPRLWEPQAEDPYLLLQICRLVSPVALCELFNVRLVSLSPVFGLPALLPGLFRHEEVMTGFQLGRLPV